jgi:uncharacterized protein (TIGR04255 family)
MTTDNLPKFDAPPVVETALSIQFSRLPGFSGAMAGWFWKEYLSKEPDGAKWNKVLEAPRIEDEFEKFGDAEQFVRFGLRVGEIESQRTQVVREGDERMIQLQDSRFILNWRKRTSAYPSFEVVLQQFRSIYPAFQRFVIDVDKGPLEENQWEVTYVNHIPQGELWQTPRDWVAIIPATVFPSAPEGLSGETLSANWRFGINGERGRLYVSVRHAKVNTSNEVVLQLTLTARGQIDVDKKWAAEQGFVIGHAAIVQTFTEMTSAEAHAHWKRRR